jgi:hypothetical protein
MQVRLKKAARAGKKVKKGAMACVAMQQNKVFYIANL